ncbi:hypothetical protein WR25_18917 [Diploscapter pachys]|uniref:Uncharacterized protein n=1 Tax=Diploscapter pachys TaxID=2018661 RepID=A0A2A2KH41_9BILA|nr:hypothetical protein WR25_18917 [Diploscapter pachys]
MSRPAEHMLRNMVHHYGRRAIAISLVAAFGSSAAFFFGYVQPRAKKYEQYFANYDPYTRSKEICDTNKGYMVSCPQELAKMAEEKGVKIQPL